MSSTTPSAQSQFLEIALFDERTALVTGGGRGIGRAISLSFAMQHATVATGYSSYKEAAFMRTGQVSGSNGGPDM